MVTVSTKNQLKRALENKEPRIEIVGELAQEIQKKSKHKRTIKVVGAALMAGSAAAAPFTAGATLPGVVAGAAALSGFDVIAIIILIFAGSITITAMLKNYDVIETEADIKGNLKFRLKRKAE